MNSTKKRVVIKVDPYAGQIGTISKFRDNLYCVMLDSGPSVYCSSVHFSEDLPRPQLDDAEMTRALQLLQISLVTLRHMQDKDRAFNIPDLLAEAKDLGI